MFFIELQQQQIEDNHHLKYFIFKRRAMKFRSNGNNSKIKKSFAVHQEISALDQLKTSWYLFNINIFSILLLHPTITNLSQRGSQSIQHTKPCILRSSTHKRKNSTENFYRKKIKETSGSATEQGSLLQDGKTCNN